MGTTYDHFVDTNKMYAAQEQFRHVTKMICDFVDLNKIDRFAVIVSLVRNAGQLPKPFWIGAACDGGSCSATTVPART